jgi:HD-GYP domain-containing protein (c-di-GMP phosphodiesterase class II)
MWLEEQRIIRCHHERWDGRGYPERLEKDAIPLGARIIGACEAFDVITSKSSYKSPLPYEMALREMDAHAGTQFDPEIVRAMRSSISEQDTIEKRPTPPSGR